jgi:hypothetical protein
MLVKGGKTMPRRKRPGVWAILYAELPPALKAKLDARAVRLRRSTTQELIVILESAMVDEPEPSTVEAKPAKPKKRK